MLQRHQRNNLDQIVSFARDELTRQLQTLKENSSRTALLSTTATYMLEMLSNLSYPLVGLQVVKQNLTNTKHPHSLQVQMILDKAELFYIQSVKHDLNKLRQEQKIQQLSLEDIKQYIQQINWKLGFDRQSILNQSQQIGDNIDLMKFFQGVRNYQNWQQNLEKRTIQKLKKFSINAQNELKLRKGYLIRKIQNIYESQIRDKKQELLTRLKKNSKLIDKLQIFNKIIKRNSRQAFQIVNIATKKKSNHQIFKQMSIKYLYKYNHQYLFNTFRLIRKKALKVINLIKTIKKMEQKNLFLAQIHFMNKFLVKKYQKIEKLGRSVQKINRLLKRKVVKQIIRVLGLSYMKLIQKLQQKYLMIVKNSMNKIIQDCQQKKRLKSMISQKIKGKILLSIQKYQNKPINLRKSFLNWYLKAKEQKYSKMIYNIWLNGSISKFTFLMRIKNIIYQGKKQKIRQQLKVFLIVLTQRMGNYYNVCQKSFINRWLQRHRYCKKLFNFINNLSQKVKTIDNLIQRQGIIKIAQTSTKKKNLVKYFQKQIKIKLQNLIVGFQIWKKLPKIKKLKGQRIFLNFIRQKLNILQQDHKQVYQIFKNNRLQGRQIKVKFISKVFSRDFAYLATFLNVWRRNVQINRMQNQRKDQKTHLIQQNSSKSLLSQILRLQNSNLKQSFVNIVRRSKFLKNRHTYALKTFKFILSQSHNKNLKSSYDSFFNNLLIGKKKKQKLVCDLVNANKVKEAQSLHIWLTGAIVQKQNDKKARLNTLFQNINKSIKPSFQYFSCYKPLNKYLECTKNNYMINVRQFIRKMKTLPPRINRRNVVRLFNNLEDLVNKGKVNTFYKFKEDNQSGRAKKRNIMSFMYNQYVNQTNKYFQMYLKNVREYKINQKFNAVLKNFQNFNNIQRSIFDFFMTGEKIWRKKAQNFNKFNFRIKQRLRQGFKLWYNTAKAISYFNLVTNQKKSRLLSTISDMISKNQFSQTKKCIHLFKKNSNIIQLQTNFLKRLCDTQAGKVIKALMIWKNLPKPNNKQLIAKASKFQRNLFHFSQKILRITMTRFKDDHYFGNDKKKLAIRNLVAKSCTGIQKYFDIWKKNNKLITLFTQCHKVQSMMEILSLTQGKLFSLLIQGQKSKRLTQSFQNIFKWWNNKRLRMFNIWRNKNSLIKAQQDRKLQSLKTIANIQDVVQKRKLKNIVIKMRKLLFLKNILVKHFIQRQKINLHQSIKNIINLPDRIFLKKQNDKKKSVLQMMKNLQKQVRSDQIKVFQIFRDEKYKGNFKKLKSCDQYLKDKISQVHKILTLWLNMTREQKRKRKQHFIQQMFESSFEISRSNFSQILQSVKATQAKKRSFQKLCQVMEIKKKGFFNIWRSKTKELKLNQMLDMANKKSILQRMNKLVSGTSKQNIKKTIKNFYMHFKISQVQVKFIQRLLQTKSGKVLQAFNKWKKIPTQNLKQNYKKGHKFFYKLQSLIKSKINQVHSNFNQNLDEGSTVKKQSVLQLLDITSTGIRRYYNRWIRITKRDHTLKQAYSMMHSLDALQNCIEENFKIIFEDPRSTRVKTWAIQKLILASGQNLKMYFKRWNQISRQIKISQEFQKKQKKTAIQIFTRAIGGSQAIQIRQVLRKFHKNLSISNISKNFISRLLKTKSGKVVQLFQLWKSIPDVKVAKKKKKAIRFESNLNKIFMKFIKSGFQPFKVSNHEARNKKRLCIQKLIRASMSEQKKKLLLWRQIVKQEKMLAHTHLFDSIFQRLNNNLSNSMMILIKNSAQQATKKKNLCRKLINNSNFTQHHAYFIWKQALQIDNVKIEKIEAKVRTNLLNLINIDEKIQNKKLIQIIRMFKKKHIFKTKLAADILKQQKNRKAIIFYNRISNYTLDKVGIFMRQIMKSHFQMNFINKNKKLQNTFENMTNIFAQNLRVVIRSNRQSKIIQFAINKIFDNFKVSTQRAFNLWRQYKNVLKIQSTIIGQKKKNVIQILNRCLQNQQNVRIPYVISKFEKNYKTKKLMKEILGKILRSKAGKVPLSFLIWKSLPNPGAKKLKQKAMKFQSRLARLVNQGIKITYQKFKDQSYEGSSKKKNAVRKLILVTMSGSNRYFNIWRNVTNEAKIAEKINSLSKLFQTSNMVCSRNISIFQNFQYQLSTKQNIVKRIVKNTSQNLHIIINQWRNVNKEQKCYIVDKTLTKFYPQHFNSHLLRQAFNRIKKKSDMQILRIYINSLWKWKVSNVQANYYAKFIKVFKESEELIILSNCINKKIGENMHSAFRKIALQSITRHQRKIQITQKYMMRKINNYFQRFKLNACFQQINTWRNMYKSTIKAKKLIELIEIFGRKQLYYAFKQIQHLQITKINTEIFNNRIERFKLLLLKNAFSKMQKVGVVSFCEKIQASLAKINLRLKTESFNLLNTTTSIITIINSIQKITQRILKRQGFAKLLQKSNLIVKCKLAINLINYMQKQTLRGKVQQALKNFKKNSRRKQAIISIHNFIQLKQQENQREFYRILRSNLDKELLLNRFKKGMVIKKILQKQDQKQLKKYFNLLKKKQNLWISLSVKRFIVRSDLKSSLAVSLWRLKNYQASLNP